MNKKRPALFLDRDGVVNVEKNYLYKQEEFEFIDGIFELCRYYQDRGYLIVIVTNQSGIARGYYTQEDFDKLTRWMVDAFAKEGVKISKVYYCPHHPDIDGECECRKPKPQMLLRAAKELDIDLKDSLLVGDSQRDIQAAHAAGVQETYLFSSQPIKSDATKSISSLKTLIKR